MAGVTSRPVGPTSKAIARIRLGIVKDEDPKIIEEKLMKILPTDEWDAGMAMSFLGREICLPKPKCEVCLMNKVCSYYIRLSKKPTGVIK